MSLISREYNCFIVLFEKYKIGRKIQALSKVIILCHRLTSAFPFLLKLASGSGFLKDGKETPPAPLQQKVLVGFENEMTPTPHVPGTPQISWPWRAASQLERPLWSSPGRSKAGRWEVPGCLGVTGSRWQGTRSLGKEDEQRAGAGGAVRPAWESPSELLWVCPPLRADSHPLHLQVRAEAFEISPRWGPWNIKSYPDQESGLKS